MRKVEVAIAELTTAVGRMDEASTRLQRGAALILGSVSVVVGVVVPLTT